MSFAFPRQLVDPHAVLGRWRPDTSTEKLTYYGWGLIGAPLIGLLYPLVLIGYIARFYSRRLDSTAARVGIVGVLVISVIVWGLLSVIALIRFPIRGFMAVAAAGMAATVSAGLAYLFSRVGGRGTTVVLAYPFALNAIFLPPVVASLYSAWIARVVGPWSETLAIWILDNILYIYGINAVLRSEFALEGIGLVAMWFGIAIPVGWLLGLLVTLADVVRPTGEREEERRGTTG